MLAGLMRRLNVCEERGSGIDKVIFEIEYYQLPAPEFTCSENHTKVVMFAHRKFSEMDRQDRIRACYQHACLLHVSNRIMTNATLRERFSIAEHNYSIASRIIADAIKAKLIKPQDPENTSRAHARYLPFWARNSRTMKILASGISCDGHVIVEAVRIFEHPEVLKAL